MLKDKKGISPIVGVILVVAMTVLLAAIAWSYMSGMISSPGKQYQVGMKVERTTEGLMITYVGGPDQDKVSRVNVTIQRLDNNSWWNENSTSWSANRVENDLGNTVGSTISITGANFNSNTRYHVVAIATFRDGTKQVIYDSVV
jgi:flagellin-like protein